MKTGLSDILTLYFACTSFGLICFPQKLMGMRGESPARRMKMLSESFILLFVCRPSWLGWNFTNDNLPQGAFPVMYKSHLCSNREIKKKNKNLMFWAHLHTVCTAVGRLCIFHEKETLHFLFEIHHFSILIFEESHFQSVIHSEWANNYLKSMI